MKTAIGVFADRTRAEEAIRKLLANHVPPERITFLTRSEPEAHSFGKHLAASDNAAQQSATPAHLTVVSIPGIGNVFVQGPEIKALAEVSASHASTASARPPANDPGRNLSSLAGAEDDAAFFRRVLLDGCSVIMVRSDSNSVATAACEVLDRLSLGIRKTAAGKSGVAVRQIPGAAVATFSGKLALDEGCRLLRETIRALLDAGQIRILLNLERLEFLDSAGLGELVRTHVAVRARGGQLTLIRPAPNVFQLFRVTKVDQVFDIAHDELSALSRGHKTNH
jgi:anti-sigma B factor antagonist